METHKLTSHEEYTHLYCHLAKLDDIIQATGWPNGEGVDIFVVGSTSQYISLTYGQLELINILTHIKDPL